MNRLVLDGMRKINIRNLYNQQYLLTDMMSDAFYVEIPKGNDFMQKLRQFSTGNYVQEGESAAKGAAMQAIVCNEAFNRLPGPGDLIALAPPLTVLFAVYSYNATQKERRQACWDMNYQRTMEEGLVEAMGYAYVMASTKKDRRNAEAVSKLDRTIAKMYAIMHDTANGGQSQEVFSPDDGRTSTPFDNALVFWYTYYATRAGTDHEMRQRHQIDELSSQLTAKNNDLAGVQHQLQTALVTIANLKSRPMTVINEETGEASAAIEKLQRENSRLELKFDVHRQEYKQIERELNDLKIQNAMCQQKKEDFENRYQSAEQNNQTLIAQIAALQIENKQLAVDLERARGGGQLVQVVSGKDTENLRWQLTEVNEKNKQLEANLRDVMLRMEKNRDEYNQTLMNALRGDLTAQSLMNELNRVTGEKEQLAIEVRQERARADEERNRYAQEAMYSTSNGTVAQSLSQRIKDLTDEKQKLESKAEEAQAKYEQALIASRQDTQGQLASVVQSGNQQLERGMQTSVYERLFYDMCAIYGIRGTGTPDAVYNNARNSFLYAYAKLREEQGQHGSNALVLLENIPPEARAMLRERIMQEEPALHIIAGAVGRNSANPQAVAQAVLQLVANNNAISQELAVLQVQAQSQLAMQTMQSENQSADALGFINQLRRMMGEMPLSTMLNVLQRCYMCCRMLQMCRMQSTETPENVQRVEYAYNALMSNPAQQQRDVIQLLNSRIGEDVNTVIGMGVGETRQTQAALQIADRVSVRPMSDMSDVESQEGLERDEPVRGEGRMIRDLLGLQQNDDWSRVMGTMKGYMNDTAQWKDTVNRVLVAIMKSIIRDNYDTETSKKFNDEKTPDGVLNLASQLGGINMNLFSNLKLASSADELEGQLRWVTNSYYYYIESMWKSALVLEIEEYSEHSTTYKPPPNGTLTPSSLDALVQDAIAYIQKLNKALKLGVRGLELEVAENTNLGNDTDLNSPGYNYLLKNSMYKDVMKFLVDYVDTHKNTPNASFQSVTERHRSGYAQAKHMLPPNYKFDEGYYLPLPVKGPHGTENFIDDVAEQLKIAAT